MTAFVTIRPAALYGTVRFYAAVANVVRTRKQGRELPFSQRVGASVSARSQRGGREFDPLPSTNFTLSFAHPHSTFSIDGIN